MHMLLRWHIVAILKNSLWALLILLKFSYQSKISKFCSFVIINEYAIGFDVSVKNNSMFIFMYLLQAKYNILEPFPNTLFLYFFRLLFISFNLFLNVRRTILHNDVESTFSPLINVLYVFYYIWRWHRC